MTWMNQFSRILSIVVVLPLILNRFSKEDVALYFLLVSGIALQMLLSGGLVSSFSRYVSYALAGASLEDLKRGRFVSEGVSGDEPSEEVVAYIRGTMRRVFGICALVSFFLGGLVGTALLYRPIQYSTSLTESYLAWAVILLVSGISLYGMRFNTVLQGANQIALEQRWFAFFSALSTISGITVLFCGGGLLALVVSNQFWLVVGYFRFKRLESRVLMQNAYAEQHDAYNRELFDSVWSPAWRSMVGIFLLNGMMHISGFIYAQILQPSILASYLLGIRLVSGIAQVSRPPFYSKIPRFNHLRALGKIGELRRLATVSMFYSHSIYVGGVIGLGLVGQRSVELIGSGTDFPETVLWVTLSLVFLLERYGAMHLQIYTTTNHVIWHTATAVTGSVAIILTFALLPILNEFSFPVAMIVGHLSYYATVVPFKSKKSLSIPR